MRFAPYAALLAEALFFFRKVLFGGEHVFPWDFRGYHLPLNQYLARCLREGTLPFWDPYTYCGYPQFANPQAQTFYPPALLTAAIGAAWGENRMSILLHWQAVLHVFLCGAFTYALLRRRALGVAAALLGASVLQLGGFFASHMQHLGLVNAVAWVPVALFAIESTGAVAGALAMSILAGFTPVVPVVFATVFAYAGARHWRRLTVASIWAVGLAAIQLVPTLELLPLTRGADRYKEFGLGGGMLWQGFLSLVSPFANGAREGKLTLEHNATFHYLFSSVTAVGLAIVSLRWKTGLIAAAFGLVTLGFNTPVIATLFPLVPGPIRSAIYLEYFIFPVLFGLALLAAYGAERLPGRWAAAACVAAVAELMAFNSGIVFNARPKSDEPAITTREFEGSRETLDNLRAMLARSRPPARIEIEGDSMNWISSAQITRVPTASGNDPLGLDRLQSVRQLYATPRYGFVRYLEPAMLDSPLPAMLNVGYLLRWWPGKIDQPAWLAEGPLPGHNVYRNTGVLPRFRLAPRVVAAASKEESLRLLGDAAFDPASVAVVEGGARSEAGGFVGVDRYQARRVELQVEAEGPSFLVTAESHYPGWIASIDGRPVEIRMTNGAFRGVEVPAGKHAVVFEFHPRVWPGAAISLGLIVAPWLARRRTAGRPSRE